MLLFLHDFSIINQFRLAIRLSVFPQTLHKSFVAGQYGEIRENKVLICGFMVVR